MYQPQFELDSDYLSIYHYKDRVIIFYYNLLILLIKKTFKHYYLSLSIESEINKTVIIVLEQQILKYP